jgi:hypothetical protein
VLDVLWLKRCSVHAVVMLHGRGALVVLARVFIKVLQGGWGDGAAVWKIHGGRRDDTSPTGTNSGTQGCVVAARWGRRLMERFMAVLYLYLSRGCS